MYALLRDYLPNGGDEMNPYAFLHQDGKWYIGDSPVDFGRRGVIPRFWWHGEAWRWQPGPLSFASEQEAEAYIASHAARMSQSFMDLRPDA